MRLSAEDVLPGDGYAGTLVGRVWVGTPPAGPRTFVLRESGLYDLSDIAPTLSDLADLPWVTARVRAHYGPRLCSLNEALERNALLAPCDLQAIKAAGVTFASSMIERVVDERARGDASAAARIRAELTSALGGSISDVEPGSANAVRVKQLLLEHGLWSQYLEVGIGPDPEIFTKAQPMSAVGCGAEIGLHPRSAWNNPEPEIVLAVSSRGQVVGATLGNDVNLRDFESRSALLLGKAKDNNASCAIGPFLRLFDEEFGLDDVRRAEVHLRVEGHDAFIEEGINSLAQISRDPADLVAATIGPEHQYPDGLMLFLGTMFVPGRDRVRPGLGFTHREGDVVRISSDRLGTLWNTVTTSDRAPPWEFGIRALYRSLAARCLL